MADSTVADLAYTTAVLKVEQMALSRAVWMVDLLG